MNAISFSLVAYNATPDEATMDGSLDDAWVVLEAANDFRDDVTVEICRRVIDARLTGRPTSPSDMHIVQNYFS